MADYTFSLNQSVHFTGASATINSQGDFIRLVGVEISYDHTGGPLQVEFFGFNFSYPSGASTMGLDLLLQIDGVDQGPFQRFIPATRFDPTLRRFAWVSPSLQAGPHVIRFSARGVLFGGPPITLQIVGDATLRLTAQSRILSFSSPGPQSVDAGSSFTTTVGIASPEPTDITVNLASLNGYVSLQPPSTTIPAGTTTSAQFTISGTTGGSDFVTATANDFQSVPLAVDVNPVLSSLSPSSGPPGTIVTLLGNGFAPGAEVVWGHAAVRVTTFLSATSLNATVPGFNGGPVSVGVEVNGQGSQDLTFQVTPPAIEVAQLSFSVLAINLQGIEDRYGIFRVSWDERYGRIANWMKANNTFPDFIVLQEVHGQSTSNNQYQVLHTLLKKIRDKTSISYRIAYLTVNPIPFPGSTLWGGLALLYNADRFTNTTSSFATSVSNYDDLRTGFHARKSLPCQASHPMFEGFCSLMDGDGISWISSAISLVNNRWVTGPVFARFETKSAPGSPIHIYNVHDALSEQFVAQFNDLVANIEEKVGGNRLYPPVVLGDFNIGVREIVGRYPGFEIAGYANREVMGVLAGNRDLYLSKQRAYARSLVVPEDKQDVSLKGMASCGGPSTLWSDHCGVFVQFSPAPGPPPVLPTGPTAQGNVMNCGEVLHSGDYLTSANGKYTLRLAGDSNLLLTRTSDNTEIWTPKPDSWGRPVGVCRLDEGQLVIYDKDGNQMWTSDSSPALGMDTKLILHDNGNMGIYRLPDHTGIWTSNTAQP